MKEERAKTPTENKHESLNRVKTKTTTKMKVLYA